MSIPNDIFLEIHGVNSCRASKISALRVKIKLIIQNLTIVRNEMRRINSSFILFISLIIFPMPMYAMERSRNPIALINRAIARARVRSLLGSNLHPKARDENGRTPLMDAVISGQTKLVLLLLKAEFDLQAQDKKGKTAFIFAAQKGNYEMLRILHEHGANIHQQDNEGADALMHAACKGSVDMVQQLIQMGANIHARSKEGYTPLISAAYLGRVPVLEFLIKSDAHLEDRTENGGTALFWACQQNQLNAVRVLINAGADIHTQDADGRSALFWVVLLGDEPIAELLLRGGADPNIETPDTYPMLMTACGAFKLQKGENVNIVKMLLESGAHIRTKSTFRGPNALMFAAGNGFRQSMKVLLDTGIDYDAQDAKGNTALMHACMKGTESCVRLLLAAGANKYIQDARGLAALHKAVRWNQVEVVKILLASCAQDDEQFATRDYCRDALFDAAISDNPEIIQVLLASGIDIHAMNASGWTALKCAASKGKVAAVETLLRFGADYLAGRKGDPIACEIALECNQSEVVDFLNEYMIGINALEYAYYKRDWPKVLSIVADNPLLLNAPMHASYPYVGTLLMNACKHNNFELCASLLKMGALVDLRESKLGRTVHAWVPNNQRLTELINLYDRKKTLQGQILVKLWEMDDDQLKKTVASTTRGHLEILGAPKILLDRIMNNN